jgi:3',5'-cyclic AMP phosphodiesterase CpdA
MVTCCNTILNNYKNVLFPIGISVRKTVTMKKYLIILLLATSCIIQPKTKEQNKYLNCEPGIYPDRIMLAIPDDPATSRSVSWRTEYSITKSLAEIARVDAAPTLDQLAEAIEGTSEAWETGNEEAMGHKVIFTGLNPETKYAYRVGDGENWSEWFQFETSSDSVEPFSFLYFGDVQNDIKSYCSRELRQAYSHFPKADFMLFAGDLVSRSTEEYWREFFYAGGWIFGMTPSIPTPGNHEYDKTEDGTRTFSKHWNQIFTMPSNGPAEKYNNRFYYMDYQGVRLVSFDSPALGENKNDSTMIVDWLDKILEENPNRWSIVFTHYPVYSCSQGRNNEKYRESIKPILEKHGVDLVLQGHDHTYCRGQNLSAANKSGGNNPVYVVSVAGPKMYGLNTSFWSDRVASNTQLYQHIKVGGDSLLFKAFTVAGELYDDFTIVKDMDGKNKFVESSELAKINQRFDIPESAKEKYSEEELKMYHEKFNEK